jgi:F-type H+-transporting ATPase subunit b
MRKLKGLKFNTASKRIAALVGFFIFNVAVVSFVFASGGGEEAAEHTPLWKEYMWKIFNFVLLIVVLFKFAKKPLANFLQKRTELIEKSLNEAKEAKEAALKALQEVEGRLKAKDSEIEQERDRIIAESSRLKDKILEQAKTNIDFEVKHAKEVIKAEAVELAMELAEKKLKDKLTKDEQERLLDDSLVKIGGKG